MKILIVDDEEHVREGIELSIDWSKHQIHQILMAENGVEALELVREHHPELIISDMSMHIMDGPQFLEKLREEGWTSKVIVLSGYQQFNYARATLLANGVDYLLKPFKIKDLDQAIEKACAQVRDEQQARLKELSNNFRLNEVNHLVKEQRFASLMEEEQTGGTALAAFLATLGIDPQQFYVISYLPRNKDAIVKQYFARDEQLFNFALNNIIEEIFTPIGKWYALQHEAFHLLLVTSKQLSSNIEQAAYRVQQAWQRTLRFSSFVGFSSKCIGADKLQQILLEEKSAILNSNVLAKTRQIEKKEASLFFIDKERLILEAVRTKNKQYLHELVDEFTNELIAGGRLTLRELQHYTVEINLLLMRIYVQLSDDRFHETMPLWLSQLEEWSTRLKQTFSDIVDMLDYSKVEISHGQSVAAVRNYINDHMKEEITLAGLAERFHFSPQYLAKRFKEEYQTTIINYLTQLRMEKACSLLTHTDLSIQEVAEESGFEELNYFSKVFKKHVGSTPSGYRKKMKM